MARKLNRLVVEISRTSVRALQTQGGVSASIMEPVHEELTAEQLRRILARLPAPRQRSVAGQAGLPGSPAEVISAIPREQVITRLFTFPATNRDELASMAGLAVKAHLPYSPEQVVSDLYVVNQQHGTSTVQVVACHRDWIDRHVMLLRQAGCEPTVITPSSWGLPAWLTRIGQAARPQPTLLVHLDEDRAELVVVWKERVVFSRSVSQGTMASDGPHALAQELERTLLSIGKELPDAQIGSFILAGCDVPAEWKGFLESRFGKPVALIGLQDRVGAVVLGLASADPARLVNLLPPAVREAQQSRRRMRELMRTSQLLCAALVLAAGVLTTAVARQRRIVARVAQELTRLESVTRRSGRHEHSVWKVEELLDSRRRTAKVLAEVLRLTPASVFFESLSCERPRGELTVRGSAPSTREVLAYLHELEQSGLWSRVELRYTSRRGATADGRTDFEILLKEGAG